MIKPILFDTENPQNAEWGYTMFTPKGMISCRYDSPNGDRLEAFYKLPFQPGDIIFVRETWAKDAFNNYVFKADFRGTTLSPEWRWKPSIHMPQIAARIWLKVTDVRVERLQDITLKNILKEGVQSECRKCTYIDRIDDYSCECYQCRNEFRANSDFSDLWDTTIKEKDLPLYGWYANPWVWVIEFERCEKPESEEVNEHVDSKK